MPRASFPNQRVVKIHREPCSKGFLQIQNENWQSACRTLRPQAFALYLYFAANADNYELELSQADVTKCLGMPRSTYYDQFRVLVNNGYIVFRGGNGYDFYEVPQKEDGTNCVPSKPEDNPNSEQVKPQNGQSYPTAVQKSPSGNGETYNRYSPTHNFIDSWNDFEADNTNREPIKYEHFEF